MIFLDRDNVILLELEQDGQPVQEGAAQRAVLWLPSRAGNGSPVVFDTDTDDDITLEESGTRVRVQGGQRTITPGMHTALLTIYDASHPNGLAWASISVRVRRWPAQ